MSSKTAAAVLVTAAVALVAPRSASAEAPPVAPPSRSMSLREALAFAREHQPQIQAARARLAAAQADAAIPGAQRLPTVSAAAEILVGTTNNTTTSYLSPRGLDIPRIGGTKANTVSFTPYPSTLIGAGLTQEVFDFGRIAAQQAVFDAAVEVESYSGEGASLDVDYAVASAYFAVQAARAVVSAAEGAYARADAHRKLAQAGVESGLRSPLELTRAEADVMRFDVGRLRARSGLIAAQSALAAAVGAPEPALDASDAPDAAGDLPALDAALAQAAQRDPAILEATARLKQQQALTRAIGAELRPDLSLSATLSARAGGADPTSGDLLIGRGFIPSVPNWDVGAVLSWKIFDGTVYARERASRAREATRRAELDSIRQQLVTLLQRAYIEADAARAALPALARSRDAANANYAQADARFKAGLATSVELADAEALRTEAEIQLALGQFEIARTRAALGRALAEGSWKKR